MRTLRSTTSCGESQVRRAPSGGGQQGDALDVVGAAAALTPYAAWRGFAAALNGSTWRRNR